eukprot:Plantae.Rhodophyta-Purpureofilum_apyrenoidigerum.ctg24922.p1 GENE.Plantae.Rhodophyta-Purpureofilum_apyrenoidigerum.ctg24922~~Plantae.Rhodophyta-Purpureofilum_apyrenoidigerum.ctg24922.p1  ORF type:complete len:361 (+),score=46.13 Plantae.Rhodophyta-Purpureofilum_apyrenoidigerum.ctg24922:115-1197(+)
MSEEMSFVPTVGFKRSVERRNGRRQTCSMNLARGLTLRQFAAERGWPNGLRDVMFALREGLFQTANRLQTAGIDSLLGAGDGTINASGEEQKALDLVANDTFIDVLSKCSAVSVIATEEEDEAILTRNCGADEMYAVVFDPLDGSSNIAACIPTGTIFGIYHSMDGSAADVLQTGTELVIGGYCLYSSSTILVIADGNGTSEFRLDKIVGDFVLTNPRLTVPASGSSYSVNEGRFSDWPSGLQNYITAIKSGSGVQGRRYDTKYICSLVADVHYVLHRGGIAMNPRSHLRLVYEGNPIALIVENAGGRASTGTQRILDVHPEKLHHRLPLFVGSSEDITELESYHEQGGVQQIVNPGYKY